MRELTPENFFIDWKDEAMIKWDRFIYNMKRYKRNLFGNLNSHDDVISFYWDNFNISLSIEDLKERPYMVHVALELSKRVLIFLPSDEDFEKLIFYDKDFLTRLSNTLNVRIEYVITRVLSLFNYKQTFQGINTRVYPIYQSEFLPFESMAGKRDFLPNTLNINKKVRELKVTNYNKTIEGVTNLSILENISAPLNDGLIYLSVAIKNIQTLKRMVIPDSVKSLSLAFIYNDVKDGVVDVEARRSYSQKVKLPPSVKSLATEEPNKFYSESLECLTIFNYGQPDEEMAKNIKVLVFGLNYDEVDMFHNLEILICNFLWSKAELPPKLKAIFTENIGNVKLPDGLKYLHISKDDEGDITVPEGLQYLHVNKTSTNLPKSLIYLYSNNPDLEVDLRTLPNLIYLKVNPEANIKNMRNNIMFEYTTK